MFKTSSKTLLIFDETQMVYKDSDYEFWNVLKDHMNPDGQHGDVHVSLLAAYGESNSNNPQNSDYRGTPFAFTNALSLEFLYFSKEECHDIISKFNNTTFGKKLPISKTVRDYIYEITYGHIGLIKTTLQCLADEFFNHSKKQIDDKDLTEYIISSNFYGHIASTRAIPKLDGTKFSRDQYKVLVDVLLSPDDRIEKSPNPDLTSTMHQLTISGVLNYDSKGKIGFPSPIIRSIQINRLFSSSNGMQYSVLFEFITASLARVDHSILKNSWSAGLNNRLYERQFQVEFYRCAVDVLGGNGYCSPDVGKLFGANGYLDFYIDGEKQWAVELVKESDQMEEHSKRFDSNNGKYKNIPIKDYAILNFVYCENHATRKRLPRRKRLKGRVFIFELIFENSIRVLGLDISKHV